jgi:hypothetical protein
MNVRRHLSVVLFPALVFLALPASEAIAQGLTGALVGTVKDQQGGVIPGAVVRVASQVLMGGEQQATANDKGQWRFPVLPPGQYTLIVEQAPNFVIYRVESLSIGAGAATGKPAHPPRNAWIAAAVVADAARLPDLEDTAHRG